MGYVSEKAVQEAVEGIVVNREKRRDIQRLSTRDMTAYLVRIYRAGFEDGADAIQKHLEDTVDHATDEAMDEVSIAWDDVLKVISEVRGIGAKTIRKIDEKLKEVY